MPSASPPTCRSSGRTPSSPRSSTIGAPYYIKEVKAVLDGTWKSHATWAGMAEDDVLVAPLANMPDDVKAMAEDTIAKIKSGALVVYGGPVYKQDGTLAVKEGEVMPDADINSIN